MVFKMRRIAIALSLAQAVLSAPNKHTSTTTPNAGSTFAGSPQTFQFPPAGVTVTATDNTFLSPTQVVIPGNTPTGDEAAAIATAPSVPLVDNVYPLVRPDASNAKSSKFDVLQSSGGLAPWQSVDSFGLSGSSPLIPEGCELTQVHLLHRHGARYPTSTPEFTTALQTAAKGAGFSASGPLEFLNTWQYKLGNGILTTFGQHQMSNLGASFRIRYGDLLKGDHDLPVWRTTSSARMVDSSMNFAAGFFGAQTFQREFHLLVVPEKSGINNTLAPYEICPNANNAIAEIGLTAALAWADIYLAPTIKRLQPFLKGVTLTPTIVVAMQQLCAYETVSLGFSEFCGLFTQQEWEQFEYLDDLAVWYSNGPGNPVSSPLGIGYVQELVSRLTKKTITSARGAVNVTQASNPVTFPLDQTIYVDATHDSVMSSIFVAMNFTSMAANGPMPSNRIVNRQSYFASQTVPFGSNLVGQVLSCPALTKNAPSNGPTHIRWILNDGVLPLTGVNGCPHNDDGLCDLPTYISAMERRLDEVDFNFGCFGNYTVSSPNNIVDGQIFPTKGSR